MTARTIAASARTKRVSPLVRRWPWNNSQTMLPPNAVLQKKLHQLYAELSSHEDIGG